MMPTRTSGRRATLAAISLLVAIACAVPLGIAAARSPRLGQLVLGLTVGFSEAVDESAPVGDFQTVRRRAAEFGTNPCGEIALPPYQFCNLSSAITRYDDTLETLSEKVELAAIIARLALRVATVKSPKRANAAQVESGVCSHSSAWAAIPHR